MKQHNGRRSSSGCQHLTACGCRWGARCCLNCPFEDCILAEGAPPKGMPIAVQAMRTQAIAVDTGTVEEVMAKYGISKRQVYRIRGLPSLKSPKSLKG